MNSVLPKVLEQLINTVQREAGSFSDRVQDKLPDFPVSFPSPVVRWTESSVRREDGSLVLRVGLPGFSTEDLDLNVEKDGEFDILSIEAKRRDSETDTVQESKRFAPVWERDFHQTLTLPEGVEKDSITAQMKDGLLTVTIPLPDKSKEEETSRKIHVNLS